GASGFGCDSYRSHSLLLLFSLPPFPSPLSPTSLSFMDGCSAHTSIKSSLEALHYSPLTRSIRSWISDLWTSDLWISDRWMSDLWMSDLWMSDLWISDLGYHVLDILYLGFQILDLGSWILDLGSRILDNGSWMRTTILPAVSIRSIAF
ncbi:unnamed protein product, partial [Laminaria digitata]